MRIVLQLPEVKRKKEERPGLTHENQLSYRKISLHRKNKEIKVEKSRKCCFVCVL